MLAGRGLRTLDPRSGRQTSPRYKVFEFTGLGTRLPNGKPSKFCLCSFQQIVRRGVAATVGTTSFEASRSGPEQAEPSPTRQAYLQQQSRLWWHKLVKSPDDFLDLRHTKTKPTQPDFRQRWVPGLASRPRALWLNDSWFPDELRSALQELEAAGKGVSPTQTLHALAACPDLREMSFIGGGATPNKRTLQTFSCAP